MTSGPRNVPVWCHALPLDAVSDARVTLVRAARRATVHVKAGDRPLDLSVQAISRRGAHLTVVDAAALRSDPDSGSCVAEVSWLAAGAEWLRLVPGGGGPGRVPGPRPRPRPPG